MLDHLRLSGVLWEQAAGAHVGVDLFQRAIGHGEQVVGLDGDVLFSFAVGAIKELVTEKTARRSGEEADLAVTTSWRVTAGLRRLVAAAAFTGTLDDRGPNFAGVNR